MTFNEWMVAQGKMVLLHANCCRVAYEDGQQSMQAKVEELEKEWLEMNQQHEQAVKECFEVNSENRKLQKRVDKAIEALKNKIAKVQKYEQDSFDHGAIIGLESALRTVEQALKGEGQQ